MLILASNTSFPCLTELASKLGYDDFNAVTTEDMALEVCTLLLFILFHDKGTNFTLQFYINI